MKIKILLLISLFLPALFFQNVFSQVEIKGTGTTGATFTLITKNSNNDTALVVKDNGRVGIGVKTPAHRLDVNGQIYASGGYAFSDGSTQTTAAVTTSYAQVFTVAISGGDFTTVQAALIACVSPSPTNQYLIRVMPGNYTVGTGIVCKKYVHLKGAGKYSTTLHDAVVGADSCVIEDFYLTHGIICIATSPTILHNIITNVSGDNSDGIYIFNGGRPWIKENEILDCNGFGINCITAPGGPDSEAWIIANKIFRNLGGGIRCENSSPLISNNFINYNKHFGIYMVGVENTPTEPTIDDNVIGHTDYQIGGVGIYMIGRAEPRIIANDIYLNETGIEIQPTAQPSIESNNLNYNWDAGIRCFSSGASKPVVILGNHIHSSARGANPAGIWIGGNAIPIIAQNIVINNDPNNNNPDIDYSTNMLGFYPILNLNVYNWIARPGTVTTGTGQYNTTSAGLTISP